MNEIVDKAVGVDTEYVLLSGGIRKEMHGCTI
jgi:hypothetical protein